ncbi:MAG: alpha/beta fold hydrolase [Candidatus Omnitrophota bacterium]
MIAWRCRSGTWASGHPYLQFGRGAEPLVVFPPLQGPFFGLTLSPGYFRYLFFAFGQRYTVYAIARKPMLSVGCSTRDMAHDYAAVIAREIGPAHVMGFSLGGMIGQYFAADHPALVRKLVLVASADRMGEEGLAITRRWIPWAREKDMEAIVRTGMLASYRGSYRWFCPFFKLGMTGDFFRRMASPADFIIALQAAMLHNGKSILKEIQAPTLMVAGDRDTFFPSPCIRETARGIPASQCVLIRGAGHGVFEEHPIRVTREILAFLRTSTVKKDPVLPRVPAFWTKLAPNFRSCISTKSN